ncbi:MAG: GatB/YqeY domain-containing protein [Solirubrobacteraceae bacterium]
MTISERVKGDMLAAMKAGERAQTGTLRLLLSELQKAAKEHPDAGPDGELAVLRRERKRRLEAERAYRDAGRDDLAEGEQAESRVIAGYLPAELSDEALGEIVRRAVNEAGASELKDLGRVMGLAIAAVDGRADGRRVSALVRGALAS